MRQLRPETGEYFAIFQDNNPIVIVFYFYVFLLTVSKKVSSVIFWTLYLKLLACEADTPWEKGNHLQNMKLLIKLYLFCLLTFGVLNVSKRLSDVRSMSLNEHVGITGRYSLKQGNPLFFFKTLTQPYLLCSFFILWLTLSKRLSRVISSVYEI